MKKLSIRLTSKMEAEYMTSRLYKAMIPYKSFTFKNNETDTEIWVEVNDIRIDGFNGGSLYFEFYTKSLSPETICVNILYIENFSIWAV